MLSHPRPHFGTDGVRGTYGLNLSPEYAYVLGAAVAQVLGTEYKYAVGRDTRTSGKELSDALISGLLSRGAKAHDFGILTTPGLATIARDGKAFCCVVTASHNPASDNGIKVLDFGGTKTSEETEAKIENKITELLDANLDSAYVPQNLNLEMSGMGSSLYVAYLFQKSGVDSLDGLNIVLDCANGAAYGMAPTMFKMFKANVTAINTESDGVNINKECGATHLEQLIAKVKETNADIGFAFDGDADRLMIVDNEGNVRNGDDILALFAIELKEQNKLTNNTVVATSMSNGGLIKFLKANDIDFIETQVGDKYVFAAMEDSGAILGGEQSGHIIRKDFAPWGDGILNALLVAQIFQTKKQANPDLTSKELLNLFVPMAQVQEKVSVKTKSAAEENEKIQHAISEQTASLGDSSRVIVRPSGTEEVVRITVEALNESDAKASAKVLADLIKEVCG